MDEEFIKRVTDYFTSAELVEILDLQTNELINMIYDFVEEKQEELEEFMKYGD